MTRKFLIILSFVLAGCKGTDMPEIQTTVVKRGTFSEELTEEGIVRAVNSIAIAAPSISYRYGGLKITSIVDDGSEVSKGDTLIVFDPSEIKRAIMTSQQQLEIANAEYEKLKATQESEIADLEADLEIARISQEISKINFEQAVYESEVTRKEINLKLESANIALVRAGEQIENKKKIQKEELFQKSLAIKQLTVSLEDANNSMKSLFVISPSPGIAIKKDNWMTGQKWGVSDQPYSGLTIIDLPDLNEMMAEVKINEVDVSKVMPGQKVIIIPDAYSDSTFTGELEAVANLAQNKDAKSKIKIFPVRIRIIGKSRNLLPGLTVSCKIIINETPDVLYIPLEALFKDQGKEFVYVRSGNSFTRRDVKIGATNTDFAVLTDGVEENEEIALSDPFLNKEEKNNADGAGTSGKEPSE
jgi:multidrug efflux pump subunit AcrA (membrane-fusion protein)